MKALFSLFVILSTLSTASAEVINGTVQIPVLHNSAQTSTMVKFQSTLAPSEDTPGVLTVNQPHVVINGQALMLVPASAEARTKLGEEICTRFGKKLSNVADVEMHSIDDAISIEIMNGDLVIDMKAPVTGLGVSQVYCQ